MCALDIRHKTPPHQTSLKHLESESSGDGLIGEVGSTFSAEFAPPTSEPILPCLFSNICITEGAPDALEPLLDKAFPDFRILTKAHRRAACALAWNIQFLADKYGVSFLGFLTLTFADHVTCPKEAQRRFHSLATNVLRSRYCDFVWVWERQKNGRIHFHLVVALRVDIRTGFDFAAIGRHDYRTANPAIRDEWAFWRKTAKGYKFGRTELLPVKSTAEGIARYVGKYISKHVGQREERDKGCKLVGYSKGARAVTARFSFATPGAKIWRQKVAAYAANLGALGATPDRSPVPFEQIKHIKGPRWAYVDRELIASIPVLLELASVMRIPDSETGEVYQVKREPDGSLSIV